MNRGTSLTIIAVGAIFAFAITASLRFLNLQVVGWILMATGLAGLLLPQRGRDWLRRTIIVRGSPEGRRSSRRGPTPPTDGPTEPIGDPVGRNTIEEYVD